MVPGVIANVQRCRWKESHLSCPRSCCRFCVQLDTATK